MDKTSRTQAALANLCMEGPLFQGDFHRFCSSFELEAGKSGVEDENVLKDMLRQAVLTDLQDDVSGKQAKDAQGLADEGWSILHMTLLND